MRIAVNVRHYLKGRIGGQENYLQALVGGLARRGHDLTVFARPSEFDAVRAMADSPLRLTAVPEEGRPMLGAIGKGRFDLLFCPLHMLEPLVPPIPSAVMIPDLQHEFFPEYFDDRELARRCRNYAPSAQHASVVLTCSEFSKRTITGRFQVDAGKVVVCGHGVGAEFLSGQSDPGRLKPLGLPQDYFYFPAVYWPHKNHANALRALRLVHERGRRDIHLVCTGGDGPGRERVSRLAAELGLSDRVKLLGRVESGLVPELYRGSRGLLFVTLFEGFGIPLLEAMQLGVPVITARCGAAAEVAGGWAVLADPLDPASIAAGMERLLSDDGLGERLTRGGRERAAEFSWERAVETTAAALERLAAPGYAMPRRIEVQEWPTISVALLGTGQAELASVRGQTYPHVECVPAADVDSGFRASSGSLFAWLRGGDKWLPGAAAAVAAGARENPRAGLIYGPVRTAAGMAGVVPYLYEDWNYGPVWAAPGAFLSRTAFAGAGGLGERSPYVRVGVDGLVLEELRLWLRVAQANPVVGLQECLADWGSMQRGMDSTRFDLLRRGAIDLIRAHFGYVPEPWIDGRSCLRLLGRTGTDTGRLRSLWLGLRANPGQRQRYLREWRRGGGPV